MIAAGKLKHDVVFERRTETVTDTGSVSNVWVAIAHARAEFINMSATEALTAFGEKQQDALVLRVRWQRGLSDLTTADRVTLGGTPYDITLVAEPAFRRVLEIRVSSKK